MTNVIQTLCAPLKNSLELLINEYHHLVRASLWPSWPFLLFSEGTLWKFNSRGREGSLGLPSGSWVQSLQAVLSSLWSRQDCGGGPEGLKPRVCGWGFSALTPVPQQWFWCVSVVKEQGQDARQSVPMKYGPYQWNYITHLPDTSPFSGSIPKPSWEILLHPTTRGHFLPVVPTLLQTFAILNLLLS